MIKNLSNDNIRTWEEDGMTFTEVIRQEYEGNNCIFSGGYVEGCQEVADTMYIRFEKDGVEPTMLLLRPDEMAAIAWVASGVCWSELMGTIEK